MNAEGVGQALENLDRRVEAIEQVLPTLATKEDLKALATKDELREAVALLATKEELRHAIEPLATKDELRQCRDDLEKTIKEEGAASRRYMEVLVERVEGKIEILAEGLVALDTRDARQHAETIKRHTALEKRVAALEASRPKRRG